MIRCGVISACTGRRRPERSANSQSGGLHGPRARCHGWACAGNSRDAAARRDRLRLWQQPADAGEAGGVGDAFNYPGFVPAFIRDSFCEGRGPFRWVALSGDPADIAKTDAALLKLFPDDERLQQWLRFASGSCLQGLPASICWLGYRERDKAGLLFNQMVRDGRLSAPIVIGRDHLDAGSVASPYRETEAMLDGSDAVSDWALLNFATGIASGAAWMSFHHGGGVGMGYSQHAGLVAVADGSDEAEQRLRLCLTNDPAMGVIRHADAGYAKGAGSGADRGLDMPSLA